MRVKGVPCKQPRSLCQIFSILLRLERNPRNYSPSTFILSLDLLFPFFLTKLLHPPPRSSLRVFSDVCGEAKRQASDQRRPATSTGPSPVRPPTLLQPRSVLREHGLPPRCPSIMIVHLLGLRKCESPLSALPRSFQLYIAEHAAPVTG